MASSALAQSATPVGLAFSSGLPRHGRTHASYNRQLVVMASRRFSLPFHQPKQAKKSSPNAKGFLSKLPNVSSRPSEAETRVFADAGGGDGGVIGGSGGGGGDGGGDDSGKPAGNVPADLAEAFAAGKVSSEILQRYLDLQKNPFTAFLSRFMGFRDRLLGDPGFLTKLAIEVGIGICTKSAAEYSKRGKNFSSELDFVLANVIMALIADFMLVWLPAPTFSVRPPPAATSNAISRFFASCPDNSFQKVPSGYEPFSLAQRVGAVVRNGSKLVGVGCFSSLVGVGITNVLIGARQMLDPTWEPLNQPQNVLVMSAAYASYMATSSNLRYQLIAGVVEERGIEVAFKKYPQVCAVLSFIVRTGNTFAGSLLWVDYIRLLGLQKAPVE